MEEEYSASSLDIVLDMENRVTDYQDTLEEIYNENLAIPFGHVALIQESFWKNQPFHINARDVQEEEYLERINETYKSAKKRSKKELIDDTYGAGIDSTRIYKYKHSTPRKYHPGLSISEIDKTPEVCFGSSKGKNRIPEETLVVNHKDCSTLEKTTYFLLKYKGPAQLINIYEDRETECLFDTIYKSISEEKQKELRKKCQNLK